MRVALPLALVLVAFVVVATGCGVETKATASTGATPPKAASLHTLPDLHPPTLRVDHPAQGTSPGYVFVAEKGGKDKPSGPVIADNKGRVLWYHEVPAGLEATDFRTQTYRGKPVLTWWQGKISKAGVGQGKYEIYDSSYRPLKTLKAANGLTGDLHEFELTPRGTAFISIYRELPYDLSPVGGPKKGYVLDSVVQELNVATGKVVFEWHSLHHVPLSESLQANREPAHHASKKRPFDYFHVNSIADGPGGTILVSARNTSALYLLRRDGSIAWRLGGRQSDFGPKAAVRFFYQHNARFHGPSTISLFDNGGIPRAEKVTRPIVLRLDTAKKTVRVVKIFRTKIASPFEGNLQLLPGGGAFVGWGGVRKVTEYSAAGKVRFQLTLPYGDTYRGYRLRWSGNPGGKPLVAVAGDRVYASWNGKLGIVRWQVLAGPDAAHLAPVASRPWGGLETQIALETPPAAVAVRALAASGRTLGQSAVLTP
ncbi:MAG TPA: arylsulfotransferase family protein [Gaiellaceae bacterium]|nr:arylsulfotransferase family protein [Gaiellaceae bacterium]